jgi:hypothetical protein
MLNVTRSKKQKKGLPISQVVQVVGLDKKKMVKDRRKPQRHHRQWRITLDEGSLQHFMRIDLKLPPGSCHYWTFGEQLSSEDYFGSMTTLCTYTKEADASM